MPSGSNKWIRPIKDNPAGKVVADPEGNRWEWESTDGTSRLLQKLDNAELSIEQTDLVQRPLAADVDADADAATRAAASPATRQPKLTKKPPSRDAGGGFNPYDHSGKPGRRR